MRHFARPGVYALPFASGEFDAVFSHALFEHLAEQLKRLRKCIAF